MRLDPHSHADLDQGRIVSLDLALDVDFDHRSLRGRVTLHLAEDSAGPLDLDSSALTIHGVTGDDGAPLSFEQSAVGDVPGQRLRILRDRPVQAITISYATAPSASALMWLDPSQTDGGVHPFVLTQCQPTHARSIVPLQDSPRARVRYNAAVTIPAALSAVMSAAPGQRRPGPRPDTATWRFSMPQPIPPYLLALAVGDLDSRDLGPRTRVHAEPGVVDAAAWEFADVEHMLAAGEALFGPYRWERYDFIVLPPSFPLGGMENPRMTFLTPTLIAGDRSLVSVLAHELAHSWTGNLVTNADNEHFWLNEGWTVYAERRILERLYGAETATQEAVLGRVALDEDIAELQAEGVSTALTWDQRGVDPDAVFSKLPYEKGFLFVTAIEQAVGRERFDAFIRRYIEHFAFTSIDSDTFVAFVRSDLSDVDVDFDAWLHGEGVPADAPRFRSDRLDSLGQAAAAWLDGQRPDGAAAWTTTEALYFMARLPRLSGAGSAELRERLSIGPTSNAELRSAWLTIAARAGQAGIEGELRDFLGHIGRTKLVRPVVKAMVEGEVYRDLAAELVAANAPRLHSSTRGALRAVVGGD